MDVDNLGEYGYHMDNMHDMDIMDNVMDIMR